MAHLGGRRAACALAAMLLAATALAAGCTATASRAGDPAPNPAAPAGQARDAVNAINGQTAGTQEPVN
jgi:hypothetical protein